MDAELLEQEHEIEEEDNIGGINITPLVDVALTLVLVFMVTMPLSVLHGITVRRQTLERYGLTTPQENVRVRLSSNGFFVKDRSGKEREIPNQEFGIVLAQLLRDSSKKQLLLECDRSVPHGRTIWVMDIAKQNGARDISLMGGKK